MSYKPIESYGVIGNLHTVALVGVDGSIDWCCLPHFDSPSIFAAILDDQKGGFFNVWNNETFRRARRMFTPAPGKPRRPLKAEQQTAIGKRIDGMALRVVNNLPEDKLICHECPIPFMQNYTDPIIADVAAAQRAGAAHAPSLTGRARHLMNYVLMGGPTLNGMWRTRTFVNKLVSLRAPQ